MATAPAGGSKPSCSTGAAIGTSSGSAVARSSAFRSTTETVSAAMSPATRPTRRLSVRWSTERTTATSESTPPAMASRSWPWQRVHHLDEGEHEVFQVAGEVLTEDQKTDLGRAYAESMAEARAS